MNVYAFSITADETERLWTFVRKNIGINIRYINKGNSATICVYEAETDEATFIALNLAVPIVVLHDR
jgi:hypothetical protein